jgi:hypothetical protein
MRLRASVSFPEGAAKALLMVTARNPRMVLEALHAA